ncbi:MAG: AraC family ligand binding domain-containing protein [Proteobacteria bacterium]|nr:AraC family ligand binding domain-containing protein [Pseudomonadota bacterium]
MNIETIKKSKKLVINRNGLKVVRLNLARKETIPEHSADADVVVVVINGKGIFSINGQANIIKKGDVLELRPGTLHAITAVTDLELIVNHMKLKTDQVEINCESGSCSHDS